MKSKPYDPGEVGKRLAAARALDIQARGNVEAALADGLARVYAPRKRAARANDE